MLNVVSFSSAATDLLLSKLETQGRSLGSFLCLYIHSQGHYCFTASHTLCLVQNCPFFNFTFHSIKFFNCPIYCSLAVCLSLIPHVTFLCDFTHSFEHWSHGASSLKFRVYLFPSLITARYILIGHFLKMNM